MLLPEQLLPPNCGRGLVQDRVRDLIPKPHVTEQGPKELQVPNPPSTKNYKNYLISIIEFL